ncbi:hypothetical protein AAHA92_14717 [Salvia divinorum]|uniref:Uncharacterized protein n=1 Tax=Salvia divinorum TaxID=28513 RepID=A0ABD1HFR5_SALDI
MLVLLQPSPQLRRSDMIQPVQPSSGLTPFQPGTRSAIVARRGSLRRRHESTGLGESVLADLTALGNHSPLSYWREAFFFFLAWSGWL